MAYTPTTWANGDTITAAGLNKMEQGIAAGGLPATPSTDGTYTLQNTVSSGSGTLAWGAAEDIIVVHDNETLDKTWQEIHDYLLAGKVVIAVFNEGLEVIQYVFTWANFEEDVYKLIAISAIDYSSTTIALYTAATADDYPAYTEI